MYQGKLSGCDTDGGFKSRKIKIAAYKKGTAIMMKMISFVIPCYRSEKTLPGVVREIQDTMKNIKSYDYEIILINDCSPDKTFQTIEALCKKIRKLQVSICQRISVSMQR